MAEPERPRRRLPVLQTAGDDAEPPERPGWHWVVLTFASTVLAWLVLASLANAAARGAPPTWAMIANAAALFVAALLAGALTGRFGLLASGAHAALGATLAAAFACALAALAGEGGAIVWIATLVLSAIIAASGGAAGHRLSRRRVRG